MRGSFWDNNCQQTLRMLPYGMVLVMLGAAAAASTAAGTVTSPPTPFKIQKCCPPHSFFNVHQRTCHSTNSSSTTWETFVGSIDIDNIVGSPECQPGEALADILSFSNASLIDQNGEMRFEANWVPPDFRAKSFCIDAVLDEDDVLVIQACINPSLICNHGLCIPKCCGLTQAYVDSRRCSESSEELFLPEFYDRVEIPGQEPELRLVDVVAEAKKSFLADNSSHQLLYAHAPGLPRCSKKYLMGDTLDLLAGYYVTSDGYLNTPRNGTPVSRYPVSDYCLETVFLEGSEQPQVIPMVCYPPEPNELVLFDILLVTALTVSCFFLAATLLTYAVLPSLQNLHGKTLMAHVASLLTAYIILVAVQLSNVNSDPTSCKALGFCMMYAFLSAFSWLNIMCIDIWWTFGAVRSSSSSRRRARNRFRAYCIYAWGFPMVVTAAGVCVELFGEPDLQWRPALGKWGCWFSYDTHGKHIFFDGPVGGQLLINLTLFILTVRYCAKVRSEISRLQDSQYSKRTKKINADKRKLAMCAKLFVVMGVTWAIEVISSQYQKEIDEKVYSYILDTPNSLQGVIIFFIFVLKRRVIHSLGARFGSCCGKNIGGGAISGNTMALALASESSPSTRSSIRIDDRLTVIRKTPSSSTLCADLRGRLSPHESFINLNPNRNLLFVS